MDFTIDEPDSDACRAQFLAAHPADAEAIRTKEQTRRDRAKAKRDAQADDDADETAESNDAS